MPPAGEGGGQEKHRTGDRRHHHEHTRVRERTEEEEREHQQRAQRHRDGDAAEQDRASRRGGGPGHGCPLVVPGGPLLAVAVDHEQAVVDAQPQSEHQREVGGERRHLRELRDHPQPGERADDGEESDRHGQQGGDGAPVDEDQQEQYDGQRERLRAQEVGAGFLADLPGDLLLATHADLDVGGGAGQPG